eukprot:scaffold9285_cov52-Attheya_sp.AAC.2
MKDAIDCMIMIEVDACVVMQYYVPSSYCVPYDITCIVWRHSIQIIPFRELLGATMSFCHLLIDEVYFL